MPGLLELLIMNMRGARSRHISVIGRKAPDEAVISNIPDLSNASYITDTLGAPASDQLKAAEYRLFDTYADFSAHISRYAGKTVTVFVNGGGPSGAGFTGVLMNVECNTIKLLMQPGPAPKLNLFPLPSFFPKTKLHPQHAHSLQLCSLPPCAYKLIPHCTSSFKHQQLFAPLASVGSIALIPVNKVAAFVHNAV